jgi:hypothetical protein
MDCPDCGLPDPYHGNGDGIGSCDCPRCPCCGAGPMDCDCQRDGEFDFDDADPFDGLCNDPACPYLLARVSTATIPKRQD